MRGRLAALEATPAGSVCTGAVRDAVRLWGTTGCLGSAAIALSSVAAGALPVRDPWDVPDVIEAWRASPGSAVVLAYVGLAALVVAWLRLGLLVRDRAGLTVRTLVTTLAWWTAPLLVAAPLYSRDVYSYLAQGAMFGTDVDPYRMGPRALGGELAAGVSPIWLDAPAPYGPLFLLVAGGAMRLAGGQPVPGILVLRLVCVLAVGVCVWVLPRLARRAGGDPMGAVWLAALNPLVLTHLVAGVHNDALMVALLLAGLLAGVSGRLALAGVAIGLAALVKAPALVAVPFLALADRRTWRSTLTLALSVGAVMAGVTAALGTWYGWVGAIGGSTRVRNGLSLVTDLGLAGKAVQFGTSLASGVDLVQAARVLGSVGAVGLVLALAARHRRRPVAGTGLAMAGLLALGPVMHPWYLLWAVGPLAAARVRPIVVRGVVALSAGLAFYPAPSGGGPTSHSWLGLAVAALVAPTLWRLGGSRGAVTTAAGAADGIADGTAVDTAASPAGRALVAVGTRSAEVA